MVVGYRYFSEQKGPQFVAKRVTEAEITERFRLAWRQIQRGASIRKVEARARVNHDELDLRQTDALEIVIATGGCRMSMISEVLNMDASNATRTVLRLIKNGYVKRQPDPDDGRAVLITPTKAGIKTWNAVNDRRTEAVVHVLKQFNKAERILLVEQLETMADALADFIATVDD